MCWPLEELDLSWNDLTDAAAGPLLAALSRRAGLRRLNVTECNLGRAAFTPLVEGAWTALTHLHACAGEWLREDPNALGAAAFAGFPALQELDLRCVRLDGGGAQLLASRRWLRLKKLALPYGRLDDAGVAELGRGEWPALERLELRYNRRVAPLALEDVRRWAPAMVEILQ